MNSVVLGYVTRACTRDSGIAGVDVSKVVQWFSAETRVALAKNRPANVPQEARATGCSRRTRSEELFENVFPALANELKLKLRCR